MQRIYNYTIIFFGFMLTGLSNSAFAAVKMLPADRVIVNLNQVIKEIKTETHIPILFPAMVPVTSKQKYYADDLIPANGNRYLINIGTTANCNGMKFCTIGTIYGTVGRRPQIYSAMHGHELTVPVKLYGNQQGYYTPAHAEADFWPAMIEWRVNNVLYNLSWKLDQKDEKSIMIDLANSALTKGAR